MTPEDEEFLTLLHQSLEQGELAPDDPRYVPISEHRDAFGPDVMLELARGVARSGEGSMAFLTGTRGCGKSTQMLRLQAELTDRGYAVCYVNLEDYLNLRQPLEIIELVYAMVGAVTDAVGDQGWIPIEDAIAIGWGRLASWFRRVIDQIQVTPEAVLSTGIDVPGLLTAKVNVTAELRQDESFVAAMNGYLAGRISELAAQANTIVGALVDRVRESWQSQGKPWRGLVVLFDSLDHVRGTDFEHVRRALQTVFDRHSRTVRLTRVRSVFAVPQWLHVEDTVRRLVNVKVADPVGDRFDDGVDALVEVVRRRVPNGDLSRLFTDDDQLRDLAADSGGHLRDLMRLLLDASSAAEDLPFDAELLDRARQLGIERLTPIADDERTCLRYVRDTHRLPLSTRAEWKALSLFDRHLVLGYGNGHLWYDVHPLIRRDLEVAAGR